MLLEDFLVAQDRFQPRVDELFHADFESKTWKLTNVSTCIGGSLLGSKVFHLAKLEHRFQLAHSFLMSWSSAFCYVVHLDDDKTISQRARLVARRWQRKNTTIIAVDLIIQSFGSSRQQNEVDDVGENDENCCCWKNTSPDQKGSLLLSELP